MGRLRQRVRNFGKIQGMPQMALVHLTTEGTLKVVGHQDMVEAVGRSNLVNILNIAPVAPATTQEEEKVDLRRISMAVDYADVRDVHLLRRAVTQVTIDKGAKGSRCIWGNEGLRPSWWPEGVPFVAPSATHTDDAGTKHRLQTASNLRHIMCSWKRHVISFSQY
ncbi:uncharacterized protein LOC124273302 isoform X1 [Haliotis rubra]|uniref:uncharacterized protein LOC124273302 isoform X1 n=1 Tax=Haliotis rubra TaxID=36100 RepID=UPI001EE60F5E|nr:uncharacterized protein LOC124273302 isoform X1 [Haliotis rubra]